MRQITLKNLLSTVAVATLLDVSKVFAADTIKEIQQHVISLFTASEDPSQSGREYATNRNLIGKAIESNSIFSNAEKIKKTYDSMIDKRSGLSQIQSSELNDAAKKKKDFLNILKPSEEPLLQLVLDNSNPMYKFNTETAGISETDLDLSHIQMVNKTMEEKLDSLLDLMENSNNLNKLEDEFREYKSSWESKEFSYLQGGLTDFFLHVSKNTGKKINQNMEIEDIVKRGAAFQVEMIKRVLRGISQTGNEKVISDAQSYLTTYADINRRIGYDIPSSNSTEIKENFEKNLWISILDTYFKSILEMKDRFDELKKEVSDYLDANGIQKTDFSSNLEKFKSENPLNFEKYKEDMEKSCRDLSDSLDEKIAEVEEIEEVFFIVPLQLGSLCKTVFLRAIQLLPISNKVNKAIESIALSDEVGRKEKEVKFITEEVSEYLTIVEEYRNIQYAGIKEMLAGIGKTEFLSSPKKCEKILMDLDEEIMRLRIKATIYKNKIDGFLATIETLRSYGWCVQKETFFDVHRALIMELANAKKSEEDNEKLDIINTEIVQNNEQMVKVCEVLDSPNFIAKSKSSVMFGMVRELSNKLHETMLQLNHLVNMKSTINYAVRTHSDFMSNIDVSFSMLEKTLHPIATMRQKVEKTDYSSMKNYKIEKDDEQLELYKVLSIGVFMCPFIFELNPIIVTRAHLPDSRNKIEQVVQKTIENLKNQIEKTLKGLSNVADEEFKKKNLENSYETLFEKVKTVLEQIDPIIEGINIAIRGMNSSTLEDIQNISELQMREIVKRVSNLVPDFGTIAGGIAKSHILEIVQAKTTPTVEDLLISEDANKNLPTREAIYNAYIESVKEDLPENGLKDQLEAFLDHLGLADIEISEESKETIKEVLDRIPTQAPSKPPVPHKRPNIVPIVPPLIHHSQNPAPNTPSTGSTTPTIINTP